MLSDIIHKFVLLFFQLKVHYLKEYFYICIEKCKQDFDTFIAQICNFYDLDNTEIEKLRLFLFNEERNKKVFEEYVYRLRQ